MRIVRRASALIMAPLVAACCLSFPARAADREILGGSRPAGREDLVSRVAGVPAAPEIAASSYVIADADTGQVLAAKDPHGKYLTASTMKALMAITLIPALDPNATVRPTKKTVEAPGTRVGMSPEISYKVQDLFRAALLVSGNDAAFALAQAGGGLKKTLAMMNAEARRLHADDTLAGSPNGLDVDLGLNVKTQHSSAYDLALIMRQGLKLPDFQRYVGTVSASFPAQASASQRKKGVKVGSYKIYGHDRLLMPGQWHYPGALGGKTGYTKAAQQNFVGAAKRNGHTIIIAMMHSPYLWVYAKKLLDWGFVADSAVNPVGTLVDPGQASAKSKSATERTAAPTAGVNGGSLPGWGPAIAGGVGGVAIVIGLFFAFRQHRSRRLRSADPAPPESAGPSTPEPLATAAAWHEPDPRDWYGDPTAP
ncbi:MAG: Serine-type D-Ala-D-Ala carboxypeptidase [Actinomycetia bacterium]|nr:Serine-type D-Ala-D-Ala carboxypeptidase [Actinomycetes bacterium]